MSQKVGPLDPLCYTAHEISEPISPLLQHYQVLLKVNDEQQSLKSMWCYCYECGLMFYFTDVGKLQLIDISPLFCNTGIPDELPYHPP